MAALQKFNQFGYQCLRGGHRFDVDSFKLALTNTAPSAADNTYTSVIVPPPTAANGYPSGGGPLSVTLTPTGAVAKVTIADYTFTATAGGIGPFRYGVIYNDDSGTKLNVAWFDHGTSITLATSETFKADFDAAAGAFTLA